MTERVSVGDLQVAKSLYEFVMERPFRAPASIPTLFGVGSARSLPILPRSTGRCWKNVTASRKRSTTGARITGENRSIWRPTRRFSARSATWCPKVSLSRSATENVDDEIAHIAGPQLVVPVNNARYALNAANARWGSLYDAFYGTDVIPEDGGLEKGLTFNKRRGAAVVAHVAEFLDDAVPLTDGSHADVTAYSLASFNDHKGLAATLRNGVKTGLVDPAEFVGYREKDGQLSNVLMRNHGLHIEIRIDRDNPVAELHPAGICDVQVESAITSIMDCEDSVAAVDAEDKVLVYSNWLGLMRGDLTETFYKQGKPVDRA